MLKRKFDGNVRNTQCAVDGSRVESTSWQLYKFVTSVLYISLVVKNVCVRTTVRKGLDMLATHLWWFKRLLPPAYVVRRGICFHRCVSVQLSWGGGVPHPKSGRGYPIPGLDRGYPGVTLPPSRTGWGTPLPIRRQSSIASTCYMAGSMPLAFTQEGFLVE